MKRILAKKRHGNNGKPEMEVFLGLSQKTQDLLITRPPALLKKLFGEICLAKARSQTIAVKDINFGEICLAHAHYTFFV